MAGSSELGAKIREYLERDSSMPTAEFRGKTWTVGQMAAHVERLEGLLSSCHVPQGAAVAIIARNRIGNAIAVAGLLASGRSVTMIYAQQVAAALSAQIEALNVAVVVADDQDWDGALLAACDRRIQVRVSHDPGVLPRLLGAAPDPVSNPHSFAEQTVEILTSGTTGTPKLIPFPVDALMGFVHSATLGGTIAAPASALIYFPLGGLGGLMHLVVSLATGAFFELLEKFEVHSWAAAIKRHAVTSLAVSPTMVRMILESDIPVDHLASLDAVYGGSGDLEDEVQKRFEDKYSTPLFWGYGATEFGGALVSWSAPLRERFGDAKAGSSGRVLPGLDVRITDPDRGEVLPSGARGRLEALVPRMSSDWIKTNDFASIDEDGFVYIYGRMDGAINRGGFKVHPETIATALRSHPKVRDAAVFGAKDDRLGEVPYAAVELLEDAAETDIRDMPDFLRQTLPPHALPVRIEVLDALPRTQSLKVDLATLRSIFPQPAEAVCTG